MSEGAERFRAAVAKKLRRRRLRWRFYAAGVVAEAGLLLAVARDPLALVLLPALALPTLVPTMLVGRIRLPNDECESDPNFEGQAAILASRFATHTYQPPGRGRDVRVAVELKTSLRRKFRGLRSRARFAVLRDAEVFLILTARSYWLWYARSLRFGDVGTIGIGLIEWTADVDVVRVVLVIGVEQGRSLPAHGRERVGGRPRHPRASSTWEATDDNPPEPDEGEDEHVVRDWHEVLGTPADADVGAIRAAYKERLKEYHPDRVAHLGEKLRNLANDEAVAINQAYAEAMRRRR